MSDQYVTALEADDDQRMKEALEEWRLTFDAIADGVAVLNLEGQVLRCNRAMADLGGIPAAQLVGQPVSTLLPEDGDAVRQVSAGAVDQRRRVSSEIAAGGRLYRLIGDPIVDPDGKVGRVVLIVADITDRRQLEDDHRQRAEQLVEIDRRKDEFLGMLAHELRNPLNAIAAANSLMERTGSQDIRSARLRNTIRRQTRHLARLVDDLLEVSRVTRGKLRLQKEPTELVGVIRSAIEHVRPAIESRGQQLEAMLPDERLCLNGDSLRLEQVFVNLLQNASKYSEAGAPIRITCDAESPIGHGLRRARVSVRDSGIGIPPAKLDAIFDLFVQVDQSLARSLGGLGLGLTIARTLVDLHGGTIAAYSEGEGHGAEFRVELPIEEVAPLAEHAHQDSDDAAKPPAGRSLVVLVVEDNRDAREMLQTWLEELGHRVHTADDGLEGLALARHIRPDVALVDIGLPGLDGYQLAQNLRAGADHEHTLLVAITGYGRPEDSARAREAGFDAHLVKPVQPEVLARILHNQRQAEPPAAAL